MTQLDDEDMSPEDEAIGMVIPDGFRLQESRPAALDNSLVKRGVLDQAWGGLVASSLARVRSARKNCTTTVCILKIKACGA